MARVTGVDRARREVHDRRQRPRIPYDYLILAAGARHAYFGHDEWEEVAPGLKKIDDATAIRHRILVAFERAETRDRSRGAPPAADLRRSSAAARPASRWPAPSPSWPRRRWPRTSAPSIRPGARHPGRGRTARARWPFRRTCRRKARRSLEKLGVEVLTNTPVELCDADGVVSAGTRIEARTIIWAAGVQASPAAKWLQADKDRAGRVDGEADLSVPGDPDIFVIGDNAAVMQADGKPVPGVAPAAKQMGAYVARVIAGRIAGKPVQRAVPLSRLRQLRHHRPPRRRRRLRLAAAQRLSGLAAVGRRPHLLPDRLPQPARGDARLAVGLRHLPARRAA